VCLKVFRILVIIELQTNITFQTLGCQNIFDIWEYHFYPLINVKIFKYYAKLQYIDVHDCVQYFNKDYLLLVA
jgi:hypothetical protein